MGCAAGWTWMYRWFGWPLSCCCCWTKFGFGLEYIDVDGAVDWAKGEGAAA